MSDKQAEQGPPADGYKLFVGDLPSDVTRAELEFVFGVYGDVTSSFLMSPHPTSGQRCALLFYAQREAAEDAIKVLNGVFKIREDAEKAIKVEWAKEKVTNPGVGKGEEAPLERIPAADGFKLFVAGLPMDCGADELKSVFSTYGEVNKVHIMAPHVHSGRVAAFVFYATSQAGEDAISLLDGKYKIRTDAAAPIQVRWAPEKQPKGDGKGGWWGDGWGSGSWFGSAYTGGAKGKGGHGWQHPFDSWGGWDAGWADGWQDDGWFEGHLGGWYEGCDNGYDLGFSKGFSKALNKGKSKGGKKGAMSKGDDWADRSVEQTRKDKGAGAGAGKGGEAKGKGATHSGGAEDKETKLFVGHLPEDIAEDALQYVFGTYGKVQHIHIMTGNSKTGQACAFVEFETVKEAETAILTLHLTYEIRPGCGKISVRKANRFAGRFRSQ